MPKTTILEPVFIRKLRILVSKKGMARGFGPEP